jgi:hypothetical protein
LLAFARSFVDSNFSALTRASTLDSIALRKAPPADPTINDRGTTFACHLVLITVAEEVGDGDGRYRSEKHARDETEFHAVPVTTLAVRKPQPTRRVIIVAASPDIRQCLKELEREAPDRASDEQP